MLLNPVLLPLFGLSTLAIIPASVTEIQDGTSSSGTCGAKISELEEEVQSAVGSEKVVRFIESDTAAFKSLDQKYSLYWLHTSYNWADDVSTCSARLDDITASFQMSNSTTPFAGVAYITVNPAVTKVVGLKIDIPNLPAIKASSLFD